MMRRIIIAAGCIDALGVPQYTLLGSPALATINVASVVLYAVAFMLVEQRRNGLAVGLVWFEVLAHSALASLLIGWDSGFHYFLLMFIPAIVVGTPRRWAVPMVGGLLVFYLGLQLACDRLGPAAPLEPWALQTAHAVNVLLIFALFHTMAAFYRANVLKAERTLLAAATTDSLTGLANRSRFRERALAELDQAQHRATPTTLILADVDHFKRINDDCGHAGGDQVLVLLAGLLRENLRAVEVLARWGGEEFLILLPDSDAAAAALVAERLRHVVAGQSLAFGAITIRLTMSFGIAEVIDPTDLDAAMARADLALYASKREGRNRVRCAPTHVRSTAKVSRAVDPAV